MNKYPTLPNPPITEAVLDIRVQLPKEVSLDTLSSIHTQVLDRFPDKEERITIQAEFNVTKDGPGETKKIVSPNGYWFKSSVDNKIFQCRLDGFTLNKLKPYNNWETFRDEAHSLWDLYFKSVHPIKITRIALRYINVIHIPLPIKEFKDYILTGPEISPKLPQALSNFFMQAVMPISETEDVGFATLTETMKPPTPDNRLPLIFDIDVYKDTDFTSNTEEIWKYMEIFRDAKNNIFFNSITDDARRLFE